MQRLNTFHISFLKAICRSSPENRINHKKDRSWEIITNMVNNELMFLIFALSVKFFKRQLNREVDKGYDRSIYRTSMHGQQS